MGATVLIVLQGDAAAVPGSLNSKQPRKYVLLRVDEIHVAPTVRRYSVFVKVLVCILGMP